MHFQKILDAADAYASAKKDMESLPIEPCDDWDCGLASDLEGSLREDCRRRLEEAKMALEAALNDYVNARLSAILNEMPESFSRGQ